MLGSLFKKKVEHRFVSIDIGTSTIKLIELDTSGPRPKLLSLASVPTPAGAFNNNAIVKTDEVAAAIRSGLEAGGITSEHAVVGIPGPCAFTKKVTLGVSSIKDLQENIEFEASNYIPHKIEAVHLDFQVLKVNGKSTMEVLLVAVKNEVVSSYVEAVEKAGLIPTIADIDFFALENMFELNYPEERDKTIAIVNIGARCTIVNILQDGNSIFTGDVSVGGKQFVEALCETYDMTASDAEKCCAGAVPEKYNHDALREGIEATTKSTTEHIASELHRQLGFFWNAAATDRQIDSVYICGGASQCQALIDSLAEKTGLTIHAIEALRNVEIGDSFDSDYVTEIAPALGVGVGLALRRTGDKQHAVG